MFGITKNELNERFIGNLSRDIKILEVGCNTGQQLLGLQRLGFKNLYAIELQPYAIEQAKKHSENLNIIQGSGFDIPFKDNFFDLVFTNGVLIHISPIDHHKFMSEMLRCSNKYIMGFEYFSENLKEINYRGNNGFLWKANFPKIFMNDFPELEEVKSEIVPYISNNEKGNSDIMYLLKKKKG